MTRTILLMLLSSLAGIQVPSVAAQEILNLSLQDAKGIALENNRDIQIEKKNVEISVGEIQTQKGIFDPVLNLSSSYTDAKIPTTSTFIESGAIQEDEFLAESAITGTLPTGTFYNILNFSLTRTKTDSPIEDLTPSWFTSLGFSIGQELLRNFGLDVNLAPVIVAKRSSDISLKQLEATISDTFLNIETNYWLVIAARENLKNQQSAFELATDLQRRNEIQVEVGVLAPVSVTEAKSEVAARQVDVINAENALRATEDALKNVLAVPLTQQIYLIDKPTDVFKSFNESEALKEALERRPEIVQANLDIKNKETQKKFFSNQRLPSLSVQGIVNLQGLGGDENPNRLSFEGEPEPIPSQFDQPSDAFRNLVNREFPTWQILGVFSFPIFNWTARGNYVKASADLDRSVISYKKVTDDVTLDVRNAIREIENSLKGIEAAKTSVDLSEEVVGNQQERLNVGIGTTRDVIEAQRDLVDARTQLIRAISDYNIALARLERAKGTIIEASGVQIKE
ncbi:MAG: TolC family protein [Thermodesulfobacteriota bacterium]